MTEKSLLKAKKFGLIRFFAPKKFANIFLKRKLPYVFPTSQILLFDKELYKARNIIESFFRYQKLQTHCHGMINYRLLFEFSLPRLCHDSNLDFSNTPRAIYKKANNNYKPKTTQNNLIDKHKIKPCQ